MGKRKITCNNSSCKHHTNGGCDTCITLDGSGKCESFEKGFAYYFHIVWDALDNKNFIDMVEIRMNPDLKTGLFYVMECYDLGFSEMEWGTCRMVMLKDGKEGKPLKYEEIIEREMNMEKFSKHLENFNNGIMPQMQREQDAAGQQDTVSDSDTAGQQSSENSMNPPEEKKAGDDYETPHPEGITSICYSCTEYETCNVKTGTCTSCDQYKNRAEAYKTDEQRYNEEQDAIDRETKKKLREQAEEEKMNNLPSDTQENGQKVHHIKLGATFFEKVASGEKTFELRKNDRDYKKGDILEMMEFKDGKNTGRTVRVLVTYILEEFAGLEDGYCIMATSLLNENGEPFDRADINQICADIRANGDGYVEGGEEYIMIENAVGIIAGGKEE